MPRRCLRQFYDLTSTSERYLSGYEACAYLSHQPFLNLLTLLNQTILVYNQCVNALGV